MYVYILNKHGEPLMQCSSCKARVLLDNKKACVIKHTPFTIKFLHGSAGAYKKLRLLETAKNYLRERLTIKSQPKCVER